MGNKEMLPSVDKCLYQVNHRIGKTLGNASCPSGSKCQIEDLTKATRMSAHTLRQTKSSPTGLSKVTNGVPPSRACKRSAPQKHKAPKVLKRVELNHTPIDVGTPPRP